MRNVFVRLGGQQGLNGDKNLCFPPSGKVWMPTGLGVAHDLILKATGI